MDKSNSFLESLKVDKETIERCDAVSKNAAKNLNTQVGQTNRADDGGRDLNDVGPASLGREAGNKSGPSNVRSTSGEGCGHAEHGKSGGGFTEGQYLDGGHGTSRHGGH